MNRAARSSLPLIISSVVTAARIIAGTARILFLANVLDYALAAWERALMLLAGMKPTNQPRAER